jgi:cell division septum initiation protein DivIVA
VLGHLRRGEVEHEDDNGVDQLVTDIEKLLRSNLSMIKEIDQLPTRLYCANISNEEMPWDPMQSDW